MTSGPDLDSRAPFPTISADAHALLAAAATNWQRPIPQCPDWDAASLVRHVGGVLGWMAAIVSSGQRVSWRSLDPAPGDDTELPDWYHARLQRTLEVLATTEPDTETWTFTRIGDLRAGWWTRRLATEIGIHRWDAEHARGGSAPSPLEGTVAAAGVAEFVREFLPGLLTTNANAGLTGTLHLHATDGPCEWSIDLGAGGTAVEAHAKADTAIRGTRSDLLLWLTNRLPADAVTIFGDTALADTWTHLRR